jgi:hypothetical protein
MAKYYLYFLFSIFLFLNVVDGLSSQLKESLSNYSHIRYKQKKENLYNANKEGVLLLIKNQAKELSNNKIFFFPSNEKETLIFSKLQRNLQSMAREIQAKITHINSATVEEHPYYRKYPISIEIKCIPEDLERLLKKIAESKEYLFIDSLYVVTVPRIRGLNVKMTLIGYQIK